MFGARAIFQPAAGTRIGCLTIIMILPLEDNFTDVIGKAQRGLGVSDSAMAAKTGVDQARIRQVR